MSKLQWGAVASVLILGIVAQIPRHGPERMPGHDSTEHSDETAATTSTGAMPAPTAVPTGRARALLNISGMT